MVSVNLELLAESHVVIGGRPIWRKPTTAGWLVAVVVSLLLWAAIIFAARAIVHDLDAPATWQSGVVSPDGSVVWIAAGTVDR